MKTNIKCRVCDTTVTAKAKHVASNTLLDHIRKRKRPKKSINYATSNWKGMEMDTVEHEIRDCFKRMGRGLSSVVPFSNGGAWFSVSQYGYAMTEHGSREEVEAATIQYYRERMNLIRQ